MSGYRKAAIVTARSASARLPRKALARIGDLPSIGIVIERAKLTGLPVILATSTDAGDDELAAVARSRGVEVFRGSLLNKLKRWHDCYEEYGIQYAAIVDGDDILYDYDLARRATELLAMRKLDIVQSPPEVICGFFTDAKSRSGVDKLFALAEADDADTDVITAYIRRAYLRGAYVALNNWEKNRPYRLTLDYPEDLEMFRQLIAAVGPLASGLVISAYLDQHPEIVAINAFRQRDYLTNQARINADVEGRFNEAY